MDTDAARRARQSAWKQDLTHATTDEEACAPEWADLLAQIIDDTSAVKALIEAETNAFVTHPDIRVALERRQRADVRARDAIARINTSIKRLNFIAPPHGRFQRVPLDADSLLRPLFTSPRAV